MKTRKAVSLKNLPAPLPTIPTAVAYLLLDHFHPRCCRGRLGTNRIHNYFFRSGENQ